VTARAISEQTKTVPEAPEQPQLLEPLIEISGLTRTFTVTDGFFGQPRRVFAVDNVSFRIAPGETLGLVGESGCGKTTLGRAMLRLIEPSEGRIHLHGRDITHLAARELRQVRRQMQIIFQDPFSSLDPRMTIHQIIAEPLRIHRLCPDRASESALIHGLLEQVGLKLEALDRYPHEFSGGQRQRIGIARALAVRPEFIVCDEPLSALDVSIQAQVINLLLDLRDSLGVGYLFISHDLEVVRFLSHRVAVMYLGRVVEIGATRVVTERPAHPYTQALLSAVPVAEPGRQRRRLMLEGDIPSPLCPPIGCSFHPRCPRRVPGTCDSKVPEMRQLEADTQRQVACHFPEV